MPSGSEIIDNITASADWTDQLLNLFWVVDDWARRGEPAGVLPDEIVRAWQQAEEARLKL